MVGANSDVRVPADGMRCGSTVGIRTKQTFVPTGPIDTAVLVNETANGYPSWLSGTVPASAAHVVIRWPADKSLATPREAVRTRAFLAPVQGYRVRVFAIPIPRALSRRNPKHIADAWTAGFSITATNQHGRVVAHLQN